MLNIGALGVPSNSLGSCQNWSMYMFDICILACRARSECWSHLISDYKQTISYYHLSPFTYLTFYPFYLAIFVTYNKTLL